MALVFAVMHLYNIILSLLLLSIPFYTYSKNSGIDKWTECSTTPECPSLMCFSNTVNTEGTNSSKNLCLTLVYVLLYVHLCQE